MLLELGKKLMGAFNKLNDSFIVSDEDIDAVIREVTMALLQADVNAVYVQNLKKEIKEALDPQKVADGANKRDLVRNVVIQSLIKLVDPGKAPYQPKKGHTNIIMFVGLQGSGKTTTVAKFARYYKKRGFKPAVVCADTFRAGAFDQLRQNAAKVGVPFFGDPDEKDPLAIAERGVNQLKKDKFDLIVVDTSGRHKQSADLLAEMEKVAERIKPQEIILVMDSTIGQSAYDQASGFKAAVSIGSVIITKLDGHAKGGGALAAVAATGSPITFLGTGEDFDSFQTFNPVSFVSRLVGSGDIQGMVEKIESMNLINKSPELIGNLVGGEFCMADLRELFEMFIQAGPLSQMMEMFPGQMGRMFEEMKEKTGGGSDRDAQSRMRNFITILDSMSKDELTSTKALSTERVRRIARGSGQPLVVVQHLMLNFKMFSRMGQAMKKLMPKGMSMKEFADYNPMEDGKHMTQQQMKALQSMIPVDAMRQMGGMSGMMNMMKQMANMKKK
ncbi:putative Signal recognition particle 54 kDa protein [Monocercomonoides exilis]|uniref:putative Signal recognition particle 54 kDa protein n=1 Tax=Monocercomonoides exilis TaxID=2049356 RepID=UPI0035596B22|nr:putative Signal recognition particle 54 kDa protein [Monocercomonoides exilis]|eukprot:MONOS_9591.1-p1 / transcript=MONOS_9591.1 / gene=MONOS_9591 / organism=Monocercomonoides_exilis_PA203 / gene_product=Signal recognition particle 54 kDa protein / transcript_product=Signal recognition particle 54 kDa protein / location=Mono_scaffold00401:36967-39221(-) / protein_length=501 / sequence_SO=supercontig / SO=protein_coding / is_pseudo=false